MAGPGHLGELRVVLPQINAIGPEFLDPTWLGMEVGNAQNRDRNDPSMTANAGSIQTQNRMIKPLKTTILRALPNVMGLILGRLNYATDQSSDWCLHQSRCLVLGLVKDEQRMGVG